MERKIVAASYDGVDPRYLEFVKQRNGKIANMIARYKGLPYSESLQSCDPHDVYVVAPTTFSNVEGERYDIKSPEDFYGLMIDDPLQVGKSILHPTVSTNPPSFYSSATARALQDYVLPGRTAFSSADIVSTYNSFDTQRFGCRLKSAGESDGNGQYTINDSSHLIHVLETKVTEEQISKQGLVIEPNVVDPKTISAGFFILNGRMMAFIGNQIDIKGSDGSNKYGGADLLVANGGFEELEMFVTDERKQQALHHVKNFIATFMNYGPIASRLSVDYLYGRDKYGDELAGCTDITGRLGGTCPGLLMAAGEFKKNPTLRYAQTSVHLNYDTTHRQENEEDAVYFVRHPKLEISAKVEKVG